MQPAAAAKAITDVQCGGNVLMNERLGRRANLNKALTCFATRWIHCEAYQQCAQEPDQESFPR